ncbi:hypothetical protein CJ030_MR3G001079 [Morella rubra]|uniref:Uncharacterized protein n=1 Tax=Morella rubra TaxID=262757 RepID=A0A6A1W6X0_9ROSI|nr:hypothetical protein CJ030_MR3G001079 [Morella rubra]
MGSLIFHFPGVGLLQNLAKPQQRSAVVTCGLRGGPRKPLWRTSVLSSEAIQAVHSLKLAKSSPTRLEEIFNSRLSRLLKADLLDTLGELHRQNELDLALNVFQFVRKEEWYEPDLVLYCDMILLLGKNKLIKMAEELFSELKKEGLQPSTRAFAEMIGAYIQVDMIEKAMETYESMKASGCTPDRLTFMILIRNLEKAGKEELAAILKKECAEYIDLPEKFLEEVEQKHVRILSLYVLMFVIVYPTLCAKIPTNMDCKIKCNRKLGHLSEFDCLGGILVDSRVSKKATNFDHLRYGKRMGFWKRTMSRRFGSLAGLGTVRLATVAALLLSRTVDADIGNLGCSGSMMQLPC